MNATLLLNELRRELLVWWSYRVTAVSTALMNIFIFMILMVLFRHLAGRYDAAFDSQSQTASLIGFLVWNLCFQLIAALPQLLEEEARVGTLENVFLSPVAAANILLARVFSLSIRFVLETAVLALLAILFLQIPLTITPTAVLITLLTLIGAVGVGLALAGLSLIYKAVGSVVGILHYLALLVSGALVPLNGLGLLFVLLKIIFPTTWGIDLLRLAVLKSGSLSALDLAGLFIQSSLLFLVGWLLFQWSVSRAKELGNLGTY